MRRTVSQAVWGGTGRWGGAGGAAAAAAASLQPALLLALRGKTDAENIRSAGLVAPSFMIGGPLA